MITNEAEAQAYCAARLPQEDLEKLAELSRMLLLENQQQNLVATGSLGSVWRRHLADSLQLVDHVPRGTGRWLDLGSGGGFPGLVVAIARPDTPVVLVESRNLRVEWLLGAAEKLGLENVEVVRSRLEAVPSAKAAAISARAFAPLSKLLTLAKRFSTPDTFWVLPKGRSAGQELQDQPSAVRRMFHVEQSLTDSEAGILIGQGVPELR